MKTFCILALFLFVSCTRSYLSVQQEWVDKGSLASNFAETPDPREKNFQDGKNILVSWDFPWSVFKQKLHLALKVRFWDQSEQNYSYEITKKRGYLTLFFPDKKKMYTYQIKIFNKQNQLVEGWQHQLWTESVKINES